jgi:hypothetical protein
VEGREWVVVASWWLLWCYPDFFMVLLFSHQKKKRVEGEIRGSELETGPGLTGILFQFDTLRDSETGRNQTNVMGHTVDGGAGGRCM